MAHKHKNMFNLISNQESDHLNPTEMPFYTYTHWQGFDGNQLCVRTRSHGHPPARLVAVVQLLSRVRFFATPWTVACQAPLSSTVSQSWPQVMSTEPVMLSNQSILRCPFSCCLQSFPASGSFPVSWPFASGGQSTGASASTSVLWVNIQGWSPLALTGGDLRAVQRSLKNLL